ncbi:MAG: response regulator [Halopseudomonas yangmingensis]|uniref:Two-component system, chemotaxis family, response regulator CheY n=1 Tax=Halopseudomonas yangmingensis TaxID=1720063 RepID=A0A1I4TW23_9GAMM|nr:response regulator [Halopseudomonas yangmingensis]SFM80780.1 two-component system, chemotaxis family, response regulator CheY [Halopseudomonas yangmingensis]
MARVLIVDDSSLIRQEVSQFLSQQGLQTLTAADGNEGLQQLRSQRDIGLVICDVNMPGLDGLSMAEKTRNELGCHTPIIMLTTENCPKMKARGKAAGVRGWIVKPFNGPATIGAIRSLLGQ